MASPSTTLPAPATPAGAAAPRPSAFTFSPVPAAPAWSTHDAFKDPKNDVILRCGKDDAVSFPYRKLYLEGASDVFEDMAHVGDGAREKDGASGLDIITLVGDEPKALAKFLIFANPRVVNPIISNVVELQGVCAIADKYQARGILKTVMSQAGMFCMADAPTVFALAVLYAEPGVAIEALGSFKGGVEPSPPPPSRTSPTNALIQPAFTPADIPLALYSRLPHAVLHALAKYQATMWNKDKADGWHELCAAMKKLLV